MPTRIHRCVFATGVVSLILLKLLTTADAQNASADEAARLVKIMGMDRLALRSLQLSLMQGQKRNADRLLSDQEKRFYQCVYTADSSAYVSIFSDEVQRHMTREEILQATKFYETDLGKKLAEQDALAFEDLLSGRTPVQELSQAELNELEQFKKTEAGKKILVQNVLNSPSLIRLLAEKNDQVARDCAKRA